MRFRHQLVVGLGALVAVIATTAAMGVIALRLTSAGEGDLAREYANDVALVQRVRVAAERLVSTTRGYLLSGRRDELAQFEGARSDLESALRDLHRGRLEGPHTRVDAVERAAHDYIAAATRAAEERGAMADASAILPYFAQTLSPRHAALEDEVDALGQRRRAEFDGALQRAQVLARQAQIALLVSSILAIGCGVLLTIVFSRRLARQFREAEEARAEATRAATAREEVLAIVSHDLRNPLQAITMGASLVAETTGEAATQRHISTIHNAASRMQHMIDEVLEAARVEAGKIELHNERIDARELLDETVDLFRARAAERHVELACESPAGAVDADRERTLEVLSNLIGNALSYARGRIGVRAEATGDAMRFTIEDDGPGIAADQLPHLFDRYWQGAPRSERGGLGLGLYICKRLVEAQRGAIGVDSKLGEGTTFWFTLPARG
jgi:signal transduction histidine kinase